MGYTTTFKGRIKFDRLLTPRELAQVDEFCEKRHGSDANENKYAPSMYCDWSTDGASVFWNGAEKSYYMPEWLEILIEWFFKPWGVTLNGALLAQGERAADIWRLECKDNVVKRTNLGPAELGYTE